MTLVLALACAVFGAIAAFWVGIAEAIAGSLAVFLLCLVARWYLRVNYDVGEAAAETLGERFGHRVANTSPLPAYVINEFRGDTDDHKTTADAETTPDGKSSRQPRSPTVRRR